MNRLEVGCRVRSNTDFGPVPHEGTIQSIVVGFTRQGPSAILRVMVDRVGEESVAPHLHESAAILWDFVGEGGVVAPRNQRSEAPKCPTCGEVHGGAEYFTPEMVELHAKLPMIPEEDREDVYVELASRFMAQVTEMDVEIPERIHKLVEKAQDAGTKARRSLLRVGRMVVLNLNEREKHMKGAEHIRKLFAVPNPTPPTENTGGLN